MFTLAILTNLNMWTCENKCLNTEFCEVFIICFNWWRCSNAAILLSPQLGIGVIHTHTSWVSLSQRDGPLVTDNL